MADIKDDWDDEEVSQPATGAATQPEVPEWRKQADARKQELTDLFGLAANSRTFGLGPKIANIAGKIIPGPEGQGLDWERKTDDFLTGARSRQGAAGMAAELIGGLRTKVPFADKVSAGVKSVTKFLPDSNGFLRFGKRAVETGLNAGYQGAVQGAGRAFGENAEGFDPASGIASALSGAQEGGMWGAGLGAAAGGVGQLLADRAYNARMASTGVGVGRVNKQMSMSPNTFKPDVYANYKDKLMSRAEEMGLNGVYPLQPAADVSRRGYVATKALGAEMEGIVRNVGKARNVDKSTVMNNMLGEVQDSLSPNASQEARDAANKVLQRLDDLFFPKRKDPITGQVITYNRKLSAEDLHEMRQSLRDAMIGPTHMRGNADKIHNNMLSRLQSVLGEEMVEAVKRKDPNAGARLRQVMDDYHVARTVGDAAFDSVPRWDTTLETLFGKGVRGVILSGIGKTMGLGTKGAMALSAMTSAPGQIPNTVLWADRMRRSGKLGSAAKNMSLVEPIGKNYSGIGGDTSTPFGSYKPQSNLKDDSE